MPPSRFLIARLSAVGDTVLTLPVACALRRAFPEAHIAWVVEQKAAPIVSGHDALDEVIVLRRGWFASPRRMLRVRQRLRRGRYDVAIDAQGLTKSALACWLSGAPRRIGWGGEHGRELSPWFDNELVTPTRPHVVDRSLELLRAVGIDDPGIEWGFSIGATARARANEIVVAHGLGRDYAVLNPSATWDSKLWEADRFAGVARHLEGRYGLRVLLVWGGPRELDRATEVAAHAGTCAVVAPPTDLMELAALLESARLYVSADGGPLHMAVAVGTPTLGLYGPTSLALCGPYGPPHVGLQIEYQSGSHRTRRQADNAAMRKITTEAACAACDQVLNSAGRP